MNVKIVLLIYYLALKGLESRQEFVVLSFNRVPDKVARNKETHKTNLTVMLNMWKGKEGVSDNNQIT